MFPSATPSPVRFSVVVPTLNEHALLEQTLSQFTPELRETYHIELIVSDGGSTDETLAVARRHADIVVEHTEQRRQNIAQGRNAGANVARGEILVFVNADTRFETPLAFFPEIGRALSSPNVHALAFPVNVFPEERIAADRIFHAVNNAYFQLLNVVGVGMGRGECQVIRRSSFEELGGYNRQLAAGEDFDLYHRLRRLGPIPFMANCMVFESPRRYRKYGYVHVLWDWFRNAISVMFARKSVSDEWEQVR